MSSTAAMDTEILALIRDEAEEPGCLGHGAKAPKDVDCDEDTLSDQDDDGFVQGFTPINGRHVRTNKHGVHAYVAMTYGVSGTSPDSIQVCAPTTSAALNRKGRLTSGNCPDIALLRGDQKRLKGEVLFELAKKYPITKMAAVVNETRKSPIVSPNTLGKRLSVATKLISLKTGRSNEQVQAELNLARKAIGIRYYMPASRVKRPIEGHASSKPQSIPTLYS
jgi:hypothetical protein